MSRAFTRDGQEGEDTGILPDRPVSPERNLVTRRGLALIEAALDEARHAVGAAEAAGDRIARANAARDLRYWAARHASAELVEPAADAEGIRFGMMVELDVPGRGVLRWRIVGEDEADATAGRISHVAPLARSLFGKDVGDTVSVGGVPARIVAVDPAPEVPRP